MREQVFPSSYLKTVPNFWLLRCQRNLIMYWEDPLQFLSHLEVIVLLWSGKKKSLQTNLKIHQLECQWRGGKETFSKLIGFCFNSINGEFASPSCSVMEESCRLYKLILSDFMRLPTSVLHKGMQVVRCPSSENLMTFLYLLSLFLCCLFRVLLKAAYS